MHLQYCFLLLKDVFFSIVIFLALAIRNSRPSMSDIAESKSYDLSSFEFGVLIVKLAMFWCLGTSNPEISFSWKDLAIFWRSEGKMKFQNNYG